MKIVLIGEAPVQGARRPEEWLHPRFCSSGRRLLLYSGWTLAELEACVERRNLYPHPVKAGEWRANQARAFAEIEARTILANAPVVLLGQRVAEAFGILHGDLFRWTRTDLLAQGNAGFVTAAVVPHPSGLNRWWNDLGNQVAARRFLRELMDGRRP